MLRQEVRAFIKAGVNAVNTGYKFNSGRITEFNSNRSNEYPYLWLESLSSSPNILPETQLTVEAWNIVIHVAKQDSPDSKPDQYEAIVDQCDLIAVELTKQLNIDLMYSDLTVIEGISREPFIHKHADNTTGVVLSFTLVDYNPTNVC